MSDNPATPAVKVQTKRKPANGYSLALDLGALIVCLTLSYMHRESIEVAYVSLGLTAALVGVRLKNGPDSAGPISAIVGLIAASVHHNA